MDSGNNNRIGLSLIAVVLCLYTFGLIETAWHLPETSHRRRTWLRKLLLRSGSGTTRLQGGNINLSVHGISYVAADDENDEEAAYSSGDDANPIPHAQWPISIRDEDGNLEEVLHPGHKAKGHPDGMYCSNVAFRYIFFFCSCHMS